MLLSLLTHFAATTVLLQGGLVIDGSGKEPRRADLRFQGEKIVAIGALTPQPSDRVISVKGYVVAPGFIDAHSHAYGGIEDDPLAVSQVTQGITTALMGQDGGWEGPLVKTIEAVKKARPSINFAAFTGHGGLRSAVMGEAYKRLPKPEELSKMEAFLDADMKAGSLGLSSGLEYDPGYYSNTEELIALARVIRPYRGVYVSHVRDEGDRALEAFAELVRIGREAQVAAHISHIKLGTKAVWGKTDKVAQMLTREHLTADVYPYTYWHSTIAALSPSRDWGDPSIWERGLADVGGPSHVRLVAYTHEPSWVGKTLAEISTQTGKSPVQIIQDILNRTEGPSGSGSQHVVVDAMAEDDVVTFLQNPHTMICSDGAIGGRHPRGAGTFPRVLGQYVRIKKTLSLQEAVRKMTSMPAKRFALAKRGLLAPSYFADIVVFDPATIADRATPADPTALSVGVEHVFVNGVEVLDSGKPTGNRPGRFLRRARP